MPKAWRNQKERRALRRKQRALGAYVTPAPAPAKKKKAAPAPSPKKLKRRLWPSLPKELFADMGLPKPEGFKPKGYIAAGEPRPAGHHVVAFCSFRTDPEGEPLKFVKYEPIPLSAAEQSKLRKRAEKIRAEIAADDARAVSRRELQLLIEKNRRNGQPTRTILV